MQKSKAVNALRVIILLLIVLVLIPLLPMILSGRWGWWQAWVYAGLSFIGFFASRGLAARRHPDILAERANYDQHENTQPWDKILSPLSAFGTVFILIAAGLDARYGGSGVFPVWLEILGLALILGGYILGTYALIENAFFSGTVRLQAERGHTVVSSGPYAWVRHPGYVGVLLSSLGLPFLLNSAWAFLPAVALIGIICIRTRLEDRFLQQQLTGYQAYARKVRYRLLPGIW
jgi:protein-S-isoprenylcysteine O-methyltransferase Ste14